MEVEKEDGQVKQENNWLDESASRLSVAAVVPIGILTLQQLWCLFIRVQQKVQVFYHRVRVQSFKKDSQLTPDCCSCVFSVFSLCIFSTVTLQQQKKKNFNYLDDRSSLQPRLFITQLAI